MSHTNLSPQEKRALLAQLLREKASKVTSVSPLSYGQQALWFIYQSAKESAAYNAAFTARIRSDVNVPALRRAFQGLINRHPALRTTFSTRDGEPVQVEDSRLAGEVHGYQDVCFEEIDASPWTWEELKVQVAKAYMRPFDLQRGPVLRVSLFTRSVQDHILLLTMHHIVCDGWSLWLLLDELRVLYPAEVAGEKASLPSLKRSYADYIRWQAEMLAGKEGERLAAYWQKQLAGELPVLNLPTDRQRPPVQTYRGTSHPFKLSEELTQRLKELARAEGTTLYMTLLAAFFVLLHRYTDQEDILVGAPTTGRTQPEFDPIVGYFVNPVVLRANLSGNPTFKAFLSQVRHTVLDALAHQDYPFSLLVKRTQPNRHPSRSPIFQVLFVFQRPQQFGEIVDLFAPGERESRVNWGGLELEPFLMAQQESQFDLTLEMGAALESLLGRFTYNTDLFEAATIQRLAGHFQTLLEGIVAHPEQRISDLPLLTEAERHQLLVEWNDTQADSPQDQCLHQWFESQVERTPDVVAVVCEDRQLTYRQLNARANQLAHHLQSLGVGPEVLVGICVERSIEMVVGLLGILKAGGAYVPLDPAYPQERLAFMLKDSQVKVLLTQEKWVEKLPEHQARVVCLDTDRGVIFQESEKNPVSGVKPDHLAYVIYSSGSTGKPKGILVSHYNVTRLFAATQSWFHFDERDVWTLFHSYAFDFSVWELWGALLYGSRLVVVPYWVSRSPAAFYDLLCKERVTVLNQTPSAFRQLIRVAEFSATAKELSLRLVIFGGEALELQHLKPWFERHGDHSPQLVNMYGITETTVHVTYRPLTRADLNRTGSRIGSRIPDMQVYILDRHLQPVPIGVPGEMYIGGAGLSRGYLNRPELTEERFILNPFTDAPGARLYKSGDLARYLPNGDIEYIGRIDHQVKIRGFRIELGEIEAVLAQHPSVQQTVVLAREDQPGDKRLVAYLVPNPEQEPTPSELRRFLKEKLPDYMVPQAFFVMLKEMPLTPNGKVDRRALPAPQQARPQLEDSFVSPRTPEEQVLAKIWAQVLGVERVGVHDNFFELGGDSILTLQILARADQAGLRLTPKQFFQHPTIAELAAVADIAPTVGAEQGLVTGPVPLTPIQHWFFERNLVDPHHFNQAFLFEVRQTLDPALLERAVQHLPVHHDALRLRFFGGESGWQQMNTAPDGTVPFTRVDFSALSDAEQGSAIEATAAELQASLNVSKGPLIRVALFELGAQKLNRLLIVIHHLAVDIISWRILLEDLWRAYQQLNRGEAIQLPPKTTSFKRWAERLTEHTQSEVLQQELDYWLTELGRRSPRLPVDHRRGTNTIASAQAVSVSLNAEETRALLQEVPSAYNTQMNDVLLCALVQAFARWTGERSLLVDLEGHGRENLFFDVDLSRTVGWFTTIFPVLLELGAVDHPGEALKWVKEQLRRLPNQGIGYGLLRYLSSDAATRRKLQALPQAEVIFNYMGQFDPVLSEFPGWEPAKESAGPTRSPQESRRYLLEIDGFVVDSRLQLDWRYSENVHQRVTVEGLARGFMEALRTLIAHCQFLDAVGGVAGRGSGV
ncbi:amino acid adenylation domain-containing protein [Candidatus Poribacteria bacterium]|nr:amino acid adenylation domain-containing protein [Candidatus Poribacteria bacterium]